MLCLFDCVHAFEWEFSFVFVNPSASSYGSDNVVCAWLYACVCTFGSMGNILTRHFVRCGPLFAKTSLSAPSPPNHLLLPPSGACHDSQKAGEERVSESKERANGIQVSALRAEADEIASPRQRGHLT